MTTDLPNIHTSEAVPKDAIYAVTPCVNPAAPECKDHKGIHDSTRVINVGNRGGKTESGRKFLEENPGAISSADLPDPSTLLGVPQGFQARGRDYSMTKGCLDCDDRPCWNHEMEMSEELWSR